MCAPQEPKDPSHERSDEELELDDDLSDDSHMTDTTVHTAEELGEIFLDFYKFLTTLHYDAADLKIPPPGEWPSITDEASQDFKSDFVMEVLRYLPYFKDRTNVHFHGSCTLVDYSSFCRKDFEEMKDRHNWEMEFYCNAANDDIDSSHFFCIATGGGTGSREFWLNAREGEMVEDMVCVNIIGPKEMNHFFRELKEK